tara:strand:- start:1103 stop:1540 length:438 start_codon:yes stop_codon:yes gene_type:complete
MTATVHRGITYTGTGTYVTTVNIDLQMQGGVDQDDGEWLTGGVAVDTSPHYPGTLGAFEPRQTDGANRFNPRLVCLSIDAALADTNTLTLSGQCSKIISVVGQHLDATAIMGVTKTSDLVLTFALKQHDDSAADVSATELWLLVV